MSNSNKIKNDLLGEPYGTASNKLRKMLLFSFAQKLNLDVCYRCGLKILLIDNFSIEHTIAWQSSQNPRETFFDLDTIAFSHLSCNIGAGMRYKSDAPYEERHKESNAKANKTRQEDKEKYDRYLRLKRERYHSLQD